MHATIATYLAKTGKPKRGLSAIAAALIVVATFAVAWLVVLERGDHGAASSALVAREQAAASGDGAVVAQFHGHGNRTTDAFVVQDGWEIRWETSGKRFQVVVTGADDVGTVVDQHDRGGGSTYPAGAGTFRVEVAAQGSWTMTILDHSTP